MKTQFKRLFTVSLCLLCFGISTYAQGIKWLENLSWEQVKTKAKAENKYIFVDCYATWCGPCKQMDKEVYPLANVGDVVNEKFISVKVQMDSTKKDAESIKQYYITARELEKKYNLVGFPTYLFFSPDGEIIHKAMGFQKSDDFIQLIKNVQVKEKQLYTQVKACYEGNMDVNLFPAFISRLKAGGDKVISLELARLYMKNYLEKLPDARFISKAHLHFMWDNQQMLRSIDRIYELCFKNPKMLDSIFGLPLYGDRMTTNILIYEYVLPAIENGKKNKKEPNWKIIQSTLINKSNNIRAEQILIDSKHYWYCVIEDWDKACEYVIIKLQRDLKTVPKGQISFQLNENAWTLFEYSFNKKQLQQGLTWMDEALALDESNNTPSAGRMDTKANLLYKLGRKEEAIALEAKASALEPAFKATLEKMKLGQPTWQIGVKEKSQVK